MKFIVKILILILLGIAMLYLVGLYLSRSNHVKIVKPKTHLELEDISFRSKNGTTIKGWFVKGEPHKAGILLMHGLRSNRLQMLHRAEILNDAGYSVLLFDFQGHGESSGDKITFGYLEALDAESGLNYLKERIGNNKLGVIGVSLGGASALLGEVKYLADAIIVESVYPTIEQAIKNRLIVTLGKFGSYLLPVLIWQLKIQVGIKANELEPIRYINQIKGALLIMGGDKDMRTPLDETMQLYDKAKQPKELQIVKGAGHINFDIYDDKYEKNILYFFDKNLK